MVEILLLRLIMTTPANVTAIESHTDQDRTTLRNTMMMATRVSYHCISAEFWHVRTVS